MTALPDKKYNKVLDLPTDERFSRLILSSDVKTLRVSMA